MNNQENKQDILCEPKMKGMWKHHKLHSVVHSKFNTAFLQTRKYSAGKLDSQEPVSEQHNIKQMPVHLFQTCTLDASLTLG